MWCKCRCICARLKVAVHREGSRHHGSAVPPKEKNTLTHGERVLFLPAISVCEDAYREETIDADIPQPSFPLTLSCCHGNQSRWETGSYRPPSGLQSQSPPTFFLSVSLPLSLSLSHSPPLSLSPFPSLSFSLSVSPSCVCVCVHVCCQSRLLLCGPLILAD